MPASDSLCHPNRPMLARGLCITCYQLWQKNKNIPELISYTEQFTIIKEARSVERSAAREAKTNSKRRGSKYRHTILKYRYGLQEGEYEKKLEAQNGVCALCKQQYKHNLYVDHCHTTGITRDLLCPRCNTLVGFLETNPELVAQAKGYIDYHKNKGEV